MSYLTRRIMLGATLLVAAAGLAGPASAQTKLKWAHVYEVAEPYHTEALWAAEEIKKRTNGKLRDRRVSRPRSSATRTRSTRGSGSAPST